MLIKSLFIFCLISLLSISAKAESALRVCSQNLARFGEPHKKGESRKEQRSLLIARMKNANCDIIALQEIYGKNNSEARRNIKDLAASLESATDRQFTFYLGETIDPYIRSGFLVAEDKGLVLGIKNYLDEPLERLQPLSQVGRFLRAPIALHFHSQIEDRNFFIFNIHFKSKSFSFKDSSGNSFEAWRMEMAEASRKIMEREKSNFDKKTVFVILGDRNTDLNGASADIISGKHLLSDFKSRKCSLNPQLEADCLGDVKHQEEFLPLFGTKRKEQGGSFGSYLYKKKEELIDEIYILPENLSLVKRGNNTYRLGMEGEFFKGSDHKLVWVEFQ